MSTALNATQVESKPKAPLESAPIATDGFTSADEKPQAETVATSAPESQEERPRELTGHDWLVATAWGIVGALSASAVSMLFVPVHLLSLTFVLGAALGTLGYLDVLTQLIRDKHNVVFGIVAALLLSATQIISPSSAVLIPAAIAGAATLAFMLVLTVLTGIAGGGDIKLSPIPAALLAAVSPIAAMLWLLFTFMLCLVVMIAYKLAGSTRKNFAMAPLMGIAAILALGAYGLLSQALGI